MGGRTDGRTAGRADGRTDGRADGRTDGRTDRRTDGRTDGRTAGRPDGWTDEGTLRASSGSVSDGRCVVSHFPGSNVCRTYMRPLPKWLEIRRTEARAFLACSVSDGRCFVSHFRGSEFCRTYMRPLPKWFEIRRTEARAFLACLSLPSGEFRKFARRIHSIGGARMLIPYLNLCGGSSRGSRDHS